jgi:hypothetical protein
VGHLDKVILDILVTTIEVQVEEELLVQEGG